VPPHEVAARLEVGEARSGLRHGQVPIAAHRVSRKAL
jgi:hypothetical protein